MEQSLEQRLKPLRERADRVLANRLPAVETAPAMLHEAMRYSVLAPGKRVRPVLTYATGQALGASLEQLDAPAIAVELIHAYSLIHDDLPAMDDDDLRRGRPTCHRQFDEATAILAGDALQALAFEVLVTDSRRPASPQCQAEMVRTLALASGSVGMAGGQAFDLAAVGKSLSLEELERIHAHKTGALIRASVRLGFLASGHDDETLSARLDEYASAIGLAFQVRDDILDVEGDTEVIGKPQGSDQAQDKPTYPDLLGIDKAKQTARDLCQAAICAVEPLGSAGETLAMLATYIGNRDH